MITVLWEKQCGCEAQSATNRLVTKVEDRGRGGLFVVTTFIPMPSCLGCDKPWRRVKPQEPATQGS